MSLPKVFRVVALVLCLVLLPSVVHARKAKPDKEKAEKSRINSSLLSAFTFRCIGPALMSGRISDIAVRPDDAHTWYVAAGSGGVWKTTNAGTTFKPVFDSQPAYSIGCITIDSTDPSVIWVGTGENVSGRHVGYGDGVYRSRNGGKTWENMGLKKSEHIGKILVDPRDSNVVFVAAEGPLWSAGGERGLYRSTDGGANWEQVLGISENTGVTDVEFEPGNPDVLYAAAYQRRRSVAAFMAGGPESGIYKSVDGGSTWRKLKVGLPGGHMGKIGLAVSPVKPNVVYAVIEAGETQKGFYRSEDRGESWEKRNSRTAGGTGPHYYQELEAHPTVLDRVFMMDVYMRVTDDGGQTWRAVGEEWKHVDNHALVILPDSPDHLLAGCDGGLYESFDNGKTWRYFPHLPLTQFYKIAVDNREPIYSVHGGTQDNNSQLGPSETWSRNGIRNADWSVTISADGYATAFDPADPDIVYGEMQNGSVYRFNRKTGQSTHVQPMAAPGEEPLRFNWDAPILVSPHNHERIYFGAQKLFRSDNRGDDWEAVSGDLTRNLNRYQLPIMERTWGVDDLWDHFAMSRYSTITAISESPLQEGLIYVGTDDGLLNVTGDGGKTWRRIDSFPGLKGGRPFVNDVLASRHNPDRVYLALDNHKTGDLKPYLFVSNDQGNTWQPITTGLSDRQIAWSIVEDSRMPELLFVGAETGIFVTLDGGKQWIAMKGGLPTIAFRDIVVQEQQDDLVCGSFGRGIYILDDYSPLRAISKALLESDGAFLPGGPAMQYPVESPLGGWGKASQGHAYYTGENPAYGATIMVHVKEGLQTAKAKRLEQEKKQLEAEKPVEFPGWESLLAERREQDPKRYLIIRDPEGAVVRRLDFPTGKGLHRVNWDLRYPAISPIQLGGDSGDRSRRWRPTGPEVVPGEFTHEVVDVVDGNWTTVIPASKFTVQSAATIGLNEEERLQLLDFQKRAGELQRKVMAAGSVLQAASERLRYIEAAVIRTPDADPVLLSETRRMATELMAIEDTLYGDRIRPRYAEFGEPSILRMIRVPRSITELPTGTAEQSLTWARERFDGVAEKLNDIMENQIPALENKLDEAGAPWTPGRKVPVAS